MPDRKIRILVIDDQPELTGMVNDALTAEGYEVLCANSGERGLEVAYTEHPDLVLLDVMMPDMDGYRVCRELQFGFTKDIPIVFLTAKTQLAHMVEASRSGAAAFVSKPFRIEHLVQTVRDVLRDASVYFDEITGLPTLANVQVEVQRMLHNRSSLGIIYVSLDGIDALERTQGFEVVDDVFRVIGRRLSDSRGSLLRAEDFVSVSSLGNAFLIVLSAPRERDNVIEEDLIVIKDRLRESLLDDLQSELSDRMLAKIDLYVGYALLVQSPKVRFKRALHNAIDQAMKGIHADRTQTQHLLRQELDRVLTGEQITCVYHPVVGLKDFNVIGYELLARGPVQSPLHRPDALFDVARDEDRVRELDRLCRTMAMRGSATLPEKYLRFINTEPLSLYYHARNQQIVDEFVALTPPALRPLTIVEITEKSIIEDFGHVRQVADQLRDHGFRVAIDDAGAGYSGLQSVVEIEPDFIKLDISLTRKLGESLVKRKLIKTLRDFCADASITLIAEGIETEEQLEILRELGIQFGQGYFFSRPGSPYPMLDPVEPVSKTTLRGDA